VHVSRLIFLSGSIGNLIAALNAVLCVTLLPVRGLTRVALLTISFYFLDCLIHLIPILGVRQRGLGFLFTRSFAEAYYAAIAMGVPHNVYLALVFGASTLIVGLWLRALVLTFRREP
jgi:hypothetical protein